MVSFLRLKNLYSISLLFFFFITYSKKMNKYNITVLDSPFHYKLVKTNLINKNYIIKIKLNFINHSLVNQILSSNKIINIKNKHKTRFIL